MFHIFFVFCFSMASTVNIVDRKCQHELFYETQHCQRVILIGFSFNFIPHVYLSFKFVSNDTFIYHSLYVHAKKKRTSTNFSLILIHLISLSSLSLSRIKMRRRRREWREKLKEEEEEKEKREINYL